MSDPAKPLLPHESTVVVEKGGTHYEGDRRLYAGPDLEIGMVSEMAPGGAEQWANFFQAAPLMARALMETGTYYSRRSRGALIFEWHTHWCDEGGGKECTQDCVDTRAALTAAGVPIT